MCLHIDMCTRVQVPIKGRGEPLELQLHGIMSHLMLVQGAELSASEGTIHALNH